MKSAATLFKIEKFRGMNISREYMKHWLKKIVQNVKKKIDNLPLLTESFDFNDLFNLSTNLLWNIDNDEVELDFGGDGEFDLLGDCKLECDVLDEFRENCLEEIAKGTDLCAGDPTKKSLPGEVDRLGPSDLEHSEILRLRQECGFEHSEMRRARFDL